MQDGPVGVRFTDGNSVFPSGQSVAATFDKGLFYARGHAMGEENKKKGVTVLLGPVAGPLGRFPEGGRNWEGFSPDPRIFSNRKKTKHKLTDVRFNGSGYGRDCQRYPRRWSDCMCQTLYRQRTCVKSLRTI